MKIQKKLGATLLLLGSLFFAGCSSAVKLEQPETFKKFDISSVGMDQKIVVAKIFNYSKDENLDKHISESVLTSELSLAGFDVLERANFNYIVDEHLFSDK
ncbi:MAG: hypothetical protein ACRC40_02035, partial [Fusobacteriaceae bacterium]